MLKIKNLEKAMSDRNISKTKLCSKTGIARTTLDAVLNGSDARISTIEAISNFLKIPVGYLFDEEPKPEDAAGYKSDLRETNYDPTNLDNINLPSDCPAHTRFLVEKEICEIRHLKNLIADKERMLDCFLDSVND